MASLRALILGFILAVAPANSASVAATPELARLEARAARVTIVRDDWGIAHVHGRTDADAVFGMVYAQAEDDFNRVETNYLTALGRLAEAEGESAIWQDLRQRLFVDPADLQVKYAESPAALRRLMDAWADGLNHYLATHPRVTPRVIKRFEPWMALSFTEGSIGGDIAKISLKDLEAFYGAPESAARRPDESLRFQDPPGSNGIAIAPSISKDGHALLLINPHTSFYFRAELQMTSDEGLNAYGAATWGQFFIYQGFNEHAGWMHTTSGVDNVDEFAETIVRQDGKLHYRHGVELRPVGVSRVVLSYRTAAGVLGVREFSVFRTHHGPIVRAADGKWIAIALMNRPVEALHQSFGRTKARDLASFLKVASLAANSSNNTLFASRKGETALLLPQFMPRRDDRFDYTRPVDGSDPATDWKGDTPLADLPQVVNPAGGWVYNANDGPWWAAGAQSPKRDQFPRYMDQVGENPRTSHAVQVLKGRRDITLQSLIDAAYDPDLPAFARLIPPLAESWAGLPVGNSLKVRLEAPVAALKSWNHRWAAESAETSLAVFWGEALWDRVAPAAKAAGLNTYDYMIHRATAEERLEALAVAVDRLTQDFGSWKTPWGQINRFQRLDGRIEARFDDAAPSIPVPFTASQWGSLAAYGAQRYPGTKKYYGTRGNSFVAVVQFGPRVRARAINAGGESGDPASLHFNDQAERYARGDLRDVYFYPEELARHTVRTYRPGQVAKAP